MNFDYKHLLPENFSKDSRIWIYQSSRLLNLNEALEIEEVLNSFTSKWISHGTPVKGAGFLFFGQFIVLMADEKATGVSGCSTDSSVRLIKEIEQKFNINMFDRNTLAFVMKDKSDSYRIQLLPLTQLQYAMDNDFINGDTLYFNNLVQSKEELENKWMIPVRQSWLKSRLKLKV